MYNSHVTTNFTYDIPTFNPAADVFLGCCLVIASIVGLIGNILALCYFRSLQTGRNAALTNSIYIAVSTIDIMTCSVSMTVVYSLFNGRLPGLFNNLSFCTFWTILFNYLQKISMFLVMLITVSRAIRVICSPYQVSVRGVVASYIGYTLVILSVDLIVYLVAGSKMSYYYSSDTVYCYEYVFKENSANYGMLCSAVTATNNIKFAIQVGIPPILIFMSFLVCGIKLLRLRSVTKQRRFSTKVYADALITTTFFTSIFLFCNLPFFVIKLLETVTTFYYKIYPGPYFDGPFMFWYSWVVAKIHFTVFNACMNPLLYYWRMSAFKRTIDVSFEDLTRRLYESSRSFTSRETRFVSETYYCLIIIIKYIIL